MDRAGASASWTKKILSAGIVSIASGSCPFDRMWKLSRQTPTRDGRPGARSPARGGSRRRTGPTRAPHRLRGPRTRSATSPSRRKLGGGELLVVRGGRRDVAADEHGVDAETIHQGELRRRTRRFARTVLGRRPRSPGTAGTGRDSAPAFGQRADRLGLAARRPDQARRSRRRRSPLRAATSFCRACRSGRPWRSTCAGSWGLPRTMARERWRKQPGGIDHQHLRGHPCSVALPSRGSGGDSRLGMLSMCQFGVCFGRDTVVSHG